jgi:hypothetical protein
MPFIRLSDNYIDHPKFIVLSDRAFRLWHEGMAYCRKHQTDGEIVSSALRGFRYAKPDAVRELSAGTAPLWETVDVGFKVHDYLDWNPCREDEQRRQQESRERTKKWRTNAVSDASRHAYVPVRIGITRSSEGVQGEPDALAVFEAFGAAWKRAYGHEFSLMLNPLGQMKLEEQAAKFSTAKLLAAIPAYFACEEAYVRNARHPLPLFLRDPLKYLAKEASVRSSGTLSPEETREAQRRLREQAS